MQKRTGWIAALFVACFAMPSNAADLANNLANTATGGSLFFGSQANWGQSFQTTTDTIITSVSVNLYRGAGATGLFSFYIFDYDINTNKPITPGSLLDRLVGQVNIATLPEGNHTVATTVTFNALSISLGFANSPYYLVAKANVTNASAFWATTNVTTGTGFPSYQASSTDDGASWSTASLAAPVQLMRITAVPEPSTYALGMIAAATFGFVSRRRARKSA